MRTDLEVYLAQQKLRRMELPVVLCHLSALRRSQSCQDLDSYGPTCSQRERVWYFLWPIFFDDRSTIAKRMSQFPGGAAGLLYQVKISFEHRFLMILVTRTSLIFWTTTCIPRRSAQTPPPLP